MEYRIQDHIVGHGDDVLQLYDAIAEAWIGRHRQTEALVSGDVEVDRQLVIDECALALSHDGLSEPVKNCARRVLEVLGVDREGAIRRLDAGLPTVEKLRQVDRRRRIVDEARGRTENAANTTVDAARQSYEKAKNVLPRWRK